MKANVASCSLQSTQCQINLICFAYIKDVFTKCVHKTDSVFPSQSVQGHETQSTASSPVCKYI